MTYWQELRREWLGTAANGGALAWLCLMFIAVGEQYNEWVNVLFHSCSRGL